MRDNDYATKALLLWYKRFLFSATMKLDDIPMEIGEFVWYKQTVAAAPTVLVAFETLSAISICFIHDHG